MRISDWSSDVCSSDLPLRDVSSTEQILDAVAFFQQFFQGEVHAFARERVDFQPFDACVFAVGRGNRNTIDDAFGNTVGPVGRNTHGYPFAIAAQDPVVNVVDGGVGRRGGQ